MSNSPSFRCFFKKKQPKAQQIQKPKCGRCSSEPAKDPQRSINNIIKIGVNKNNVEQINSSINSQLKSINPTPTVKLDLENTKERKDISNYWIQTMGIQNENTTKFTQNQIKLSNSSSNHKNSMNGEINMLSNSFEESQKEIILDWNNEQVEVLDLSEEYADFSNRFSEISPIPTSDKKNTEGIWVDKIDPIPMQSLNYDPFKEDQQFEEDFAKVDPLEKNSILLVDNYEPIWNKEISNIFELNVNDSPIIEDNKKGELNKDEIIGSFSNPKNISSSKILKNLHSNI